MSDTPEKGRHPAVRDGGRCPSHPGALLADVAIPASGKSMIELAKLLGLSLQHLYDIAAEKKPVSPRVAVKLGKLFGNGPNVWIGMQTAYDLWHAETEVDVSKIPTLDAA